MTKVLLDTNAYRKLFSADRLLLKVVNEAREIILPVFVVAELLVGYKNGTKEDKNRSILEDFESEPSVHRYYPSHETAEIYSDLFLELKKAGTPIPLHDIWIAAIAIETGSVIVTYDQHFTFVKKARLWNQLK